MQDLANEIACLLEPVEPLGHRFVMLRQSDAGFAPFFEAKAVRFKGGVGYVVREAPTVSYGKPTTPVAEFETYFAPTADALKFAIRKSYNRAFSVFMVLVIPHGVEGYSWVGEGVVQIELGEPRTLEVGEADSFTERALGEAIAALSLMQLPAGFKVS